jgi:hypothetical protein
VAQNNGSLQGDATVIVRVVAGDGADKETAVLVFVMICSGPAVEMRYFHDRVINDTTNTQHRRNAAFTAGIASACCNPPGRQEILTPSAS